MQNGVPPSLVSHITENVTTAFVLNTGEEGYSYRAPAHEGKDFYIGVYGFSYDFENIKVADTTMREPLYYFTITASTAPRLSGLSVPTTQFIASTYRYFFAFRRGGEYTYYAIPHNDMTKDLHIVVRVAAGVIDIVVSNTVQYPRRTELEHVGWSSFAVADGGMSGGMSVNIHSYDPAFKPGVFYVGTRDCLCVRVPAVASLARSLARARARSAFSGSMHLCVCACVCARVWYERIMLKSKLRTHAQVSFLIQIRTSALLHTPKPRRLSWS